jgi:PAS domain S-box-containing protein
MPVLSVTMFTVFRPTDPTRTTPWSLAALMTAGGSLCLAAWSTAPSARWLTVHPSVAPLPSLTFAGVLVALAFSSLVHGRERLARGFGVGAVLWSAAQVALASIGRSYALDRPWLAYVAGVVPTYAAWMTIAQFVSIGMLAVAVLLLTARRVNDRTRLASTTIGILLVGLLVLRVLLAGTRLQGGVPPLGQLSIVGLAGTFLGCVVLFMLVADHQDVPNVPPRWSPEVAGGVAVMVTIVFARILEMRVTAASTGGHADALPLLEELPHLAMILGLCVSALLTLVLRLLRNNWLQARRLEHDRLSAALDSATDGVWEYDFDTQRAHRSAAQLRYLGYDAAPSDAARAGWFSLLHPDDVERASAALAHWARTTGDQGEITYRVRAADRTYHTIVDRGRVVERHADGRPRLMMGISADVTERVRADAAREASELRYRVIFESALQGQALLDAGGRCVDVNSRALDVLGIDRHDVIGVPFTQTGWFTGLRGAQARLADGIARAMQGESVRCELETHQLDGTVGLVECSLTPLETPEGSREVLCELRDVTARRRAEEALREIGTLSTLGRLAARMAHEINNPLAGIRNSVTLLADAVPDTHPYRRFLHSIEREIDRIAMVTRALYETYREDHDAPLDSSLIMAVSDAVSFLAPAHRGRGVRITTDVRDAPSLVPVPDALLRQTLYNLIQNAAEASPTGGTVRVRAWQDGASCCITVADDGPPIPRALRDRIFEPHSGQRTVQLRSGPMGFGLATVRQSLGALGGSVRLVDAAADGEAMPPAGVTFEVRLPMNRAWAAGL